MRCSECDELDHKILRRFETGSAPRRGDEAVVGLLLNVCLWHLADVRTALMNVRFEVNNGHDADVTRCLIDAKRTLRSSARRSLGLSL